MGRFECGDTPFEVEAGRNWEQMGIFLLVHLPALAATRRASGNLDVRDAVQLIYVGLQLSQCRRADGGIARQKLPEAQDRMVG